MVFQTASLCSVLPSCYLSSLPAAEQEDYDVMYLFTTVPGSSINLWDL
jgi:hypothetical protein